MASPEIRSNSSRQINPDKSAPNTPSKELPFAPFRRSEIRRFALVTTNKLPHYSPVRNCSPRRAFREEGGSERGKERERGRAIEGDGREGGKRVKEREREVLSSSDNSLCSSA